MCLIVKDVECCQEPGKVIIMGVLMGHVEPASSAREPLSKQGKDVLGWGLEAASKEEGRTTDVHAGGK